MRATLSLFIFSIAACSTIAEEPLPNGTRDPGMRDPGTPDPGTMDPGIVDPGTGTTGPRLVARYVEAVSGGARRFLHFFDRELGQPCRLGFVADDGRVRCTTMAYGWWIYLDDKCTTPYVAVESADEWVNAQGYPGRGGTVRVGAPINVDVNDVYVGGGDYPCHPAPIARDLPRHEIAEVLPEEKYAYARLDRVPANDQLDKNVITTDEGGTVVWDVIDRLANAICTPVMTEAGLRCQAELDAVIYEGYLDTSCEKLVVMTYGLIGNVAEVVRGRGIYRFERAEDQEHVGRDTSGSCSVEEIQRGRMTLYTGVPHPPSEWPAMSFVTSGSGVVANLVALPSGEIVDSAWRIDRTEMFENEGVPCGPMWIGDSLRCTPLLRSTVASPRFYSDARCTQLAAAIYSPPREMPQFVSIQDGEGGADQAHLPFGRVYEVDYEMRDWGFEFVEGAGCRRAAPSARLFALKGEVAADQLPELRLVAERRRP